MAALMVIIIINFIVPANNTQKTLEIVLTPVMTSKKQVIATTDSNCWQVPCTLATGVKVLWRTTAGRSSPVWRRKIGSSHQSGIRGCVRQTVRRLAVHIRIPPTIQNDARRIEQPGRACSERKFENSQNINNKFTKRNYM